MQGAVINIDLPNVPVAFRLMAVEMMRAAFPPASRWQWDALLHNEPFTNFSGDVIVGCLGL